MGLFLSLVLCCLVTLGMMSIHERTRVTYFNSFEVFDEIRGCRGKLILEM